jgi:hypothetical protein
LAFELEGASMNPISDFRPVLMIVLAETDVFASFGALLEFALQRPVFGCDEDCCTDGSSAFSSTSTDCAATDVDSLSELELELELELEIELELSDCNVDCDSTSVSAELSLFGLGRTASGRIEFGMVGKYVGPYTDDLDRDLLLRDGERDVADDDKDRVLLICEGDRV